MNDMFDEFESVSKGCVDICPSCGALLSDLTEVSEGCNDPMGCGAFLEGCSCDEDEDEEIQELNFD